MHGLILLASFLEGRVKVHGSEVTFVLAYIACKEMLVYINYNYNYVVK